MRTPTTAVIAATSTTQASQVATRPSGAVGTGDGSTAGSGSPVFLYLAGGVALLAGSGGAAWAARRSARATH
ncbi:hypothetical protein [Geodermatophilus sp. URMC 64]